MRIFGSIAAQYILKFLMWNGIHQGRVMSCHHNLQITGIRNLIELLDQFSRTARMDAVIDLLYYDYCALGRIVQSSANSQRPQRSVRQQRSRCFSGSPKALVKFYLDIVILCLFKADVLDVLFR